MTVTDARTTLLIADDDKDSRTGLANLLRRQNYRVRVARSGREAISKFSPKIDDAVLLDIAMPGLDGIETAKKILSTSPRTPILFVTANFESSEYHRRCDEAHLYAQPWIEKPVTGPRRAKLLQSIQDEMVIARILSLRDRLFQEGLERASALDAVRRSFDIFRLAGQDQIARCLDLTARRPDPFLEAREEVRAMEVNLLAYEKAKERLQTEHSGEFAAFLDGHLVACGPDRSAVIKKLYIEHGRIDALLVEVGQLRSFRVRAPRRSGGGVR